MSNDVKDFLDNKANKPVTVMKVLSVLEADDIVALDMLLNDQKMNVAEVRHYITGAKWSEKIAALVSNDFFSGKDIQVIEKLVSKDYLTSVERRDCAFNDEFKEKIEILKNAKRKDVLINDVQKIRSRGVPEIEKIKEGDQLLMSFEFKKVKDHFWCTVTHVETMFKESKSPLLTISINVDNKADVNKFVSFGRDNKVASTLLDYSLRVSNNLEISENAYNKRVLDVKPKESPKSKMKLK